MKKKLNFKIPLIILGVIVVVIILLIGRRAITPLTYSNLSDEKTLNEVSKELSDSGVPKENVDIFKEQVRFTNNFLGEYHSFKNGYTSTKGTIIKYDEMDANRKFIKVVLPDDLNCRLAAWNLVEDIVTVDPIEGDIEGTEEGILEYYPNPGLDKEDKGRFWGVYKGISIDKIKSSKGYAKVIEKEWKSRNLKFEESNRKLISCFTYNLQEKKLEAQHAGVMIERENDLLFIEKYNPQLPFQVSVFKDRKDLEYYIKQRFASKLLFQVIIMENDKML